MEATSKLSNGEAKIGVVVPVCNEVASIAPLHGELSTAAATVARPFHIVYVDDGSTDDTWGELLKLQAQDGRVAIVRLRRNFGKAAALAAGFAATDASVVFTLDGDLQDDPSEIPRFLERLEAGADLVSGWKQARQDPWHKTLPSRLFNLVVGWTTGVRLHDHNCGFKAYRREVLAEVPLYGELYRYIPVLAAARGFKVAEVAVRHRPRRFGKSKFGWKRFARGFLDLLTVRFLTLHQHRPQHLLGGCGLLATLIGLIWLLGILLFSQRGDGAAISIPAMLVALFATGIGIHLLTLGLLAELLVARSMWQFPPYAVAERRPALADGAMPAR